MKTRSSHDEVAALFKRLQIEQKLQHDDVRLTLEQQDFILDAILKAESEKCERALGST